jgi:hypothetical protein
VRLGDREYRDEEVEVDRLRRLVGVLHGLRLSLRLGLRPRLRLLDRE